MNDLFKIEPCKVCSNSYATENTFGFSICNACKLFLLRNFKSKTIHKSCYRNPRCFVTSSSDLKDCPCCFLKKCVDLKMDPHYETRRELNNVLRRSFPYHPCPTCTSNTYEEFNRDRYGISSYVPLESDRLCKVCGDSAVGYSYSVSTCNACSKFFRYQVTAKKAHKQCSFNQQCTITKESRTDCPCCRLKKCLALGMDPSILNSVEISYESIIHCQPPEWFMLLACKTCDLEKNQKINKVTEDLKYIFMATKEKSTMLLTTTRKEVTEVSDIVQGYVENDNVDCLKSHDSDSKHFASSNPEEYLKEANLNRSRPTVIREIGLEKHFAPSNPEEYLKETNLNRSRPTIIRKIDLGYISNSSSGHIPFSASNQSAATVENSDAISFEEGLEEPSVEATSLYMDPTLRL